MSDESAVDLTLLLQRAADGDADSRAQALERVYGELHAVAEGLFARERKGHTLQPTVLVHDAFMRLVASDCSVSNKQHFMVLATRAMRRVLTDYARRKRAERRGGGLERVTFHEGMVGPQAVGFDPVLLDDALTRLGELNERHAKIVELKLFAGLEHAEVAEVMGLSVRSVESHWPMARAWLLKEIC